jgi:putative transposase
MSRLAKIKVSDANAKLSSNPANLRRKHGTRFAALEPISQGLMATVGSVAADVGRVLALRMSYGSQHRSDHFQNHLKHWGINPSFAFIEQPQINGVTERFFRILKEQVIYGRIFRNREDVRQAVAECVEIDNHAWRLERMGSMSPVEFKNSYLTKEAA